MLVALLTFCPPSMERIANALLGPRVLAYKAAVERARGLLAVPYEEKLALLRPMGLRDSSKVEVDSLFLAYHIVLFFNQGREWVGKDPIGLAIGNSPWAIRREGMRTIILGRMKDLNTTDVVIHELIHLEGEEDTWKENTTAISYCLHELGVEDIYRRVKVGIEYPVRAYLLLLAPFVKAINPYAQPQSIEGLVEGLSYNVQNPNMLLAYTYYSSAFPMEQGRAEGMARALFEGMGAKLCCEEELFQALVESLTEARGAYEALRLMWERAKELAERRGIAYDIPKP